MFVCARHRDIIIVPHTTIINIIHKNLASYIMNKSVVATVADNNTEVIPPLTLAGYR